MIRPEGRGATFGTWRTSCSVLRMKEYPLSWFTGHAYEVRGLHHDFPLRVACHY
jgi:hypothetical protein